MDPLNPSSYNHRVLKLSTGRSYHFVDQLPENYDANKTVSIVLVHGFPDFWYGWRYQIGPLVREGYRVIAPDMLGYGGTDKPADPAEYTMSKLTNDLAALLNALEIQSAVFIGHDWGSLVVQRFSVFHPQRILALAFLSVGWWTPAQTYIPLEDVVKREANWGYMLFFASPESNQVIDANLPQFFQLLYRYSGPPMSREGQLHDLLTGKMPLEPKPEPIMSEKEFGYYLENFPRINGALNYYRTTKHRFDDEGGIPSSPSPDLPCLFLVGKRDPTALPSLIEQAKRRVPQLESEVLDEGHWLMIGKAKDEVRERLVTWVNKVVGPQGKQRSLL